MLSSSGSPRLNCCFARRLSTSTPHESTTPSSNRPLHLPRHVRNSLCLALLGRYVRGYLFRINPAQDHQVCRHHLHRLQPAHPSQSKVQTIRPCSAHTNPIGSHMPGWLPSSRCIRSAPPNTAKPRPLDYRGAPDTALGLLDNLRRGGLTIGVAQDYLRQGDFPAVIRFVNDWTPPQCFFEPGSSSESARKALRGDLDA